MMRGMRLVLNIIWLVLSGFWMFLAYLLAGVLLCIPIITIPWAIASFRVGLYALWPFGRTIVDKPGAGVVSFLGNVIWVIFAGIWLAIGHIVTGVAMCLAIIGIPLGIASFKLVPISLMPLGKDIVDVDAARGAVPIVRACARPLSPRRRPAPVAAAGSPAPTRRRRTPTRTGRTRARRKRCASRRWPRRCPRTPRDRRPTSPRA